MTVGTVGYVHGSVSLGIECLKSCLRMNLRGCLPTPPAPFHRWSAPCWPPVPTNGRYEQQGSLTQAVNSLCLPYIDRTEAPPPTSTPQPLGLCPAKHFSPLEEHTCHCRSRSQAPAYTQALKSCGLFEKEALPGGQRPECCFGLCCSQTQWP